MEQEKTQQGMSKEQLRNRLDVFSSSRKKIEYIEKITDKYFVLHPQTRLNLETILLEEKIKGETLNEVIRERAYNPTLSAIYPKVLSDLINSGIELSEKSFSHAIEFYYVSKEDVPTELSSKTLDYLNKHGVRFDKKCQGRPYLLPKNVFSDVQTIDFILKDADKDKREYVWKSLFSSLLEKGEVIGQLWVEGKEGIYGKLKSRSGEIENPKLVKKFCSDLVKRYLSGKMDTYGGTLLMPTIPNTFESLPFLREANDRELYEKSINTILDKRWDEHPLALRMAIQSGHTDLIEKTKGKLKKNLELAIGEENFYYAHKIAESFQDEELQKKIYEEAQKIITLAEEYAERKGEVGYKPTRIFKSKNDLLCSDGGAWGTQPGIIGDYAEMIGDNLLRKRAIDVYNTLYKLEHPQKPEKKPQPTIAKYEKDLNLNGLRKLKGK
jgi:hypothetical protein